MNSSGLRTCGFSPQHGQSHPHVETESSAG
jgi:hypothetical protein